MSLFKSLLHTEFAFAAAGLVGSLTLRALHLGTQVRFDGTERLAVHRDSTGSVCFVSWHEQLLLLAYALRHRKVAVLASNHRDGEYIARVLDHLGYSTVRGSSTRGGSKALRGLVRAAAAGRDLAITPDGPRGPARVFPPRALSPAALSGLSILPVAAGIYPARRVEGSWDRMWIPRPRARIRVVYGAPRAVPSSMNPDEATELAAELGDELIRLTEIAESGARADWASDHDRNSPRVDRA